MRGPREIDRVSLVAGLAFAAFGVVLLLDRSGSMGGWKMVAARRAAARVVDTLTAADRFAVLTFDHQIGRPDEVVGAPADAYVKDFVSEVPKSHVLTLRWVMRPPEAGEADSGPVLQSDVIVRDAAREVLAARGPVRVFDGDEFVGIVDDEDILRVVVAEEASAS